LQIPAIQKLGCETKADQGQWRRVSQRFVGQRLGVTTRVVLTLNETLSAAAAGQISQTKI
jgi:hypothetical protein